MSYTLYIATEDSNDLLSNGQMTARKGDIIEVDWSGMDGENVVNRTQRTSFCPLGKLSQVIAPIEEKE